MRLLHEIRPSKAELASELQAMGLTGSAAFHAELFYRNGISIQGVFYDFEDPAA